ncbi:MAG: hypothetical protein ACYDAQ_01125, partial [Mycobacteriales bacterium]
PLSVRVLVTGLATQGAEPEFGGSPSPGLSVTVSPATADLQPGSSVQVHLSVAVGPRAGPGGLFAGLVFRGVAPASGGTVRVVGEIGRPLLVRVPGRVTDTGVIAGFTALAPTAPSSPVRLVVRFTDTGDVSYPIGGAVALSEPGRPSANLPVSATTVLPGDTREVTVPWAGPAPAGLLTARLELAWGLTGEHRGTAVARVTLPSGLGLGATASPTAEAHRSGGASPVDWLVRVVAGLLVLLLLLLLLFAARRRHRERDQ